MAELGTGGMIVLIVLIVTIGRIMRAKYGEPMGVNKLRRLRSTLLVDDGASAAEAERLRGEVTRLNERIQVLERLATDPGKRLSDEIDALKLK